MTRYAVRPSGSGWVVKRGNGSVVSNHRKKSRAKKAAQRAAGRGDSLTIHRSDGTIQDRRNF